MLGEHVVEITRRWGVIPHEPVGEDGMRTYLLSSAALLAGLCFADAASAQMTSVPTLVPGQIAPNGFSQSALSPGSVIIRLGGALDWYAGVVSDSGDHTTLPGATQFKQANYEFGAYMRLYPTIDGIAANGLRYGVFSELREEAYLNTGGGSLTSISQSDRTATPYFRRAYAYFGTGQIGFIRVGLGDGAGGLFDTGTFQNFDQGGWNGDIPGFISGNAQSVFPFQGGVGAWYDTDKITYLSPQIYGVEFGISYEPSTAGLEDFDTAGIASSSSIRLESSSVAGDLHRRKNVINPELRYRQTFGPFGVAGELGYYKSATVGFDGQPTSNVIKYKGFDFADGGIVLTFGGLSVGGHIMSGAFAGQGALAPQGTRDAFAYIAGLSYTNGPYIVGGSFFQYNFAGNSGLSYTANGLKIGQERDRGIAAGGTYTLIPGLSLFLSYVYGTRRESQYDLLNAVANSNLNNNVRSQALGFGTQIRW